MSRYQPDPDFEPRIADWLEADPDRARRCGARHRAGRAPVDPAAARHARCRGGCPSMSRFALPGPPRPSLPPSESGA